MDKGENRRLETVRQGTLGEFRGLLESLEAFAWRRSSFKGKYRQVSDKHGQYIVGWTPPKARSFQAGESPPPQPSQRTGLVDFVEIPEDRIRIAFLPGDFPEPDLFWQAVDNLLAEMERLGFFELPRAGEDDGEASLPEWFPKKTATLKRWKEAFSVIVELRRTYREEYGSWEREDPNPKLADYVDAIAGKMRWRPSSKTVGRIAKAGDNGWLE